MRITLRSVSWLVGSASLVVPGVYVAVQLRAFNEWAHAQEGGVCGMPVLGIWLGAMVMCALLSGVSLVLNGIDLRRSQRSIQRYAEFAVLAAPALCVALLLLAAMVT